jgi:hypothetical protein
MNTYSLEELYNLSDMLLSSNGFPFNSIIFVLWKILDKYIHGINYCDSTPEKKIAYIEDGVYNSWENTSDIRFKLSGNTPTKSDYDVLYKTIYEYSLVELVPYLNTELEPIIYWRYSLSETIKECEKQK